MDGGPWEPTGVPPPGRNPVRHLDEQSRHAARWFAVRLCCVAAIAALGAAASERLVQAFAGLATLTCALGAVVGAVLAVFHGESFGRGGLNAWDEALAFLALSRLAHFATTLLT